MMVQIAAAGRPLMNTAHRLIVHTSKIKRSADFIALLETLDVLSGPQPGPQAKPVVIVLDNGPVHASKATTPAFAARSHWLTAEWLPKYAPELNDIEIVWRDLKAHHLAHQTFTDAEALDRAIHTAVTTLNAERTVDPLVKQRNLNNPPFANGYWIGHSSVASGSWQEVFNSDAEAYGGANIGNLGAAIAADGLGINVVLPANGVEVFSKVG